KGAYTVAFDIDEIAVGRNYHTKRNETIKSNMLPLVQDLTNPSPGLGWAHHERESFTERGPADVAMALALIHHLAIGNNLPFDQIAQFLRSIAKNVIIEFVPKEDSKVQLLLSSREDIFVHYDAPSFEAAMAKHFKLISREAVKGSKRSLYLYQAR
ncbi:MAG: SAM-dependent methyltransferase, partial [Candidatus Saccharimonadales bacterium]